MNKSVPCFVHERRLLSEDVNFEIDWGIDEEPTKEPTVFVSEIQENMNLADMIDEDVNKVEEYGSVEQSVIHEVMVTEPMRKEAEKRFYMHFGFEFEKLFDKKWAGNNGIHIVSREAPTESISDVVPTGMPTEDIDVVPTGMPTEDINGVPTGRQRQLRG